MRKANKKQASLYVFVYDISDNKERNKVDKTLQDYGFRVQKSVYECRLTVGNKSQLLKKLTGLNIVTGHIRCYSVKANHVKKIGNVPKGIDDDYVYFID